MPYLFTVVEVYYLLDSPVPVSIKRTEIKLEIYEGRVLKSEAFHFFQETIPV
jgi:hypothetical protein